MLNKIGHRELIIYPIDSLTVYSALHNACGISPCSLNSSQNMNKGEKKKTYLYPLFFSTLACCFGKPRSSSN